MMEGQGGIITHKSQGRRWHWDLSGSIDSRLSKRCVSIEGSIKVGLTWRHDVTQCFVWDLGISAQMALQRTNEYCLRESNLGAGGIVMFPFFSFVGFNIVQNSPVNEFLKHKNIQWREHKIYIEIFSRKPIQENLIDFSLYSFQCYNTLYTH